MAGAAIKQEVPEQQPLMDDKTTGAWSIGKDAGPFFTNGIDWAKWEAEARPPGVYDPPQLQAGYMSICTCINWWTPRSPFCAQPSFPCCCASSVYGCCIRNVEYLPLADPDAWMAKMLSTGASPKCPKRFQGIFWMQDNIAPEQLVTFHDADWATERLALKQLRFNWTRSPTMWGAGLFCFNNATANTMRIEVSPNEKWVCLSEPSGSPAWMYSPSPGEVYTRPTGETITPGPGDLWRVSYQNNADTTSPVVYQYLVRRVAYLDDYGKLVKTEAYKDLEGRATMPLPPRPTQCCGYLWCSSAEETAFKTLPELSSQTVVMYAPPAPGSS